MLLAPNFIRLKDSIRLASCGKQLPAEANHRANATDSGVPASILIKSYYWVTHQSEYSTDILFKTAAHLIELYPRLVGHSTLRFGTKEAMSFLGRKIRPYFELEIVSDVAVPPSLLALRKRYRSFTASL